MTVLIMPVDKQKSHDASVVAVESVIHIIRGERVILDADLARIYGVPTKRLNEQVRRNAERFPTDFMFQVVDAEYDALRSQIATLDANEAANNLKSQFATSSSKRLAK